jgi:putative redox protein
VSKPPTVTELTWAHDLVFDAVSGAQSLRLDGDSRAGASPMQLLAIALAGCMSMDVAHVLARGRHPVRAIRSRLVAERSPDDPHRFVAVAIHFAVEGAVPRDAVERAMQLSHDKYCSVWHSMRQDIPFTADADVIP